MESVARLTLAERREFFAETAAHTGMTPAIGLVFMPPDFERLSNRLLDNLPTLRESRPRRASWL